MKILDNILKIKEGVLGVHGLKKTFTSILSEIENIKGSIPLSNIFELIGNTLEKNNIYSIVCIINEKRNETIIRNINFPTNIKNIFFKEEIKNIAFYKFGKYNEVIFNKESVFCQNRFAQLNKIYKNHTNLFYSEQEINSVIAPLVLKGEIIGTLEIFSPVLKKDDLSVVDDFVKRLVASITNNILFYEIKESEKRYRNLFKNAGDGLAFFSLEEKRFKESNPAMRDLSGYTQEELKQLHYLLLFLRDDRKEIEEIINKIRRSNNKIVLPVKFCLRIKTKKEEIKICDIEIGMQLGNKEVYFSFKDVTSQKNSDNALRESEEKYRKLVDNAGDGVLVCDLDGKIVFINKAMIDILEGESENILDKNIIEFVFAQDKKKVFKNFFEEIIDQEKNLNHDFRINTFNGKQKYINCNSTIIVNNGRKTGIQTIIRDISKEREIHEQTDKTKRHYISIIDSIKDDIIVIDNELNIVSVNNSFATNVGLDYKEIKGKQFDSVMNKYKNSAFATHCFNKDCEDGKIFLKVFETGIPEYYIESGDNKNHLQYFGIGIFPIKSNDKIHQVVTTIRDISESKAAEEENKRLREFNQKILDLSPVSIAVLNRDGEIISGNGMAKKLLGDKQGNFNNIKLIETRAIKNNEELKAKYDLLLKKGTAFIYDNLSYKAKGSEKTNYLSIIAVPLYDKEEQVDGVISMAIDNTEKVIAKQKLLKLNKELELKVESRTAQLDEVNKELKKVLELKVKFISDASHELRTPLTVMQGNLDLVKQEYMNKKTVIPEIYELVGKEVDQMTGILSDLTMLTSTDASRETIQYDNVDLNLLIAAVVQSLRVLAIQKNLTLSTETCSDTLQIVGDEAKLERMMLNIVRNAIKYTEEGGSIEIKTSKENNLVKIMVKDTGIGIPKEDMPYIFERFYRVDKARSRKEGGTGLGLSICKWIAESHNGNISVESEIGKGSEFVITIPVDRRRVKREK